MWSLNRIPNSGKKVKNYLKTCVGKTQIVQKISYTRQLYKETVGKMAMNCKC